MEGGFPPILGGHLLNQVQKPPKTSRVVSLRSCTLQFQVNVDEAGEVSSYTLITSDPQEQTTYEFTFGEDVRTVLTASLGQLPRIGTKFTPDGGVDGG